MNRLIFALIGLGVLAGCMRDETLSAYAAVGKTYELVDLNGSTPSFPVTLRLGHKGAMSGQAQCNSYMTTTQDPYPWMNLTAIAATKRACPHLAEEAAFFDALESMTLAEAAGPVVLLSNDAGDEMEFRLR
ncbi:MAG: META domain-containing protein, partial [Pseudomonadota bacterium]